MPAAYIGRLAPSPTGLLHLGHAATFWTAFTRARNHHGTLLLRNDDLDPHRSRNEFVDAMLEDLAWLGIEWTAPIITQSQRMPLYRAALDQLLATGHVYSCTCSRRDLTRMAHAPHEDTDDEPVYPGTCRPQHAQPGQPFQPHTNYRFRVPDAETIHFTDLNLGPQAFTSGACGSIQADFGDFLVWRKDGVPSYQLACIVDDDATHITEVVRGRDLLKSTARQICLQRALNLPTPDYFHTSLITDEHGIRLAKRHDALAVRTLRERGHTPAELIASFSSPR